MCMRCVFIIHVQLEKWWFERWLRLFHAISLYFIRLTDLSSCRWVILPKQQEQKNLWWLNERDMKLYIYIYFIAAVSFDFICILIHGERKGRKINQYHTSWNGYKYSKNKYMIVHAGGKLQVFGKCLVFRAIDHVYPSLLSALRDLAACNWPAAWGAGSKLSFESTTRKSYLKCDDGIIFTSKCKR